MNETPLRPLAYCFRRNEKLVKQTLCDGITTVVKNATVTAKDMYLCAVVLKAVERLPFVTPGVTHCLMMITKKSAGQGSNSVVIEFGEDFLRLGFASSSYSPDVGSDTECHTNAEFGIGWRECRRRLLLDWLTEFNLYVSDQNISVWFDDNGEKIDIDWDLEPTTDKDWIDEIELGCAADEEDS